MGINVFRVRELVNTLPNDPSKPSANPIRNMHFPGAGVGGHCLPKDPWLLKYGVDTYGKFVVEPSVIVKSRELNLWMPTHMANLVEEGLKVCGREEEGAKIAILGVAFMENSDDTRNTPSKTIYELLMRRGAKPVLHDPYVQDFDLPISNDLHEAITSADAIVIVTKHNEYLNLDLRVIKDKMRTPLLVDGRDVYKKSVCEKVGFLYLGVGKPH